MKKQINIINLCFVLAILVGDVFYIFDNSLWLKSILSAGFVLIGVINLIYALKNQTDKKKFAIIMLIGLIFAMFGDIVLEIHFICGALLFAIGHVFYFVAYCCLVSFNWKNLIYGAFIFVPVMLFIVLAPIFNFGDIVMEVVCIVYALIISCMVSKAISNYVCEKNRLHLLILIGSVLFLISDFVLLLNVFSEVSKAFSFMCIATYYPAQCFLAYSISNSVGGIAHDKK